MSEGPPISISHLVGLQVKCVREWHTQPVRNDGSGFDALVLANHGINFRLWHEEDQARAPEATDEVIAQVKRRIDRLNQQRSDSIERLDNAISEMLIRYLGTIESSQPMNTETPGSAIDRLSILSLRVFHLDEQCRRLDIDDALRNRVTVSLHIAEQQRLNLSVSLQQLIDDLLAGRKRHCTFQHLKMYNDPELNPMIYEQKGRSRN